MKGLDTSFLLGILDGDPATLAQLKRLRGQEIATTEVNILELACVAVSGPIHSKLRRLETVSRLRRRITVLPFDARGAEAVAKQLGKGAERLPLTVLAMLGILDAAGCDELFTRKRIPDLGAWRVKVTLIAKSRRK